VRAALKAPFSPLTAQLADRAACRSRPPPTRSWETSSAPRRCAWARGSSSSAWPRTGSSSSARPHYFDQSAAKFDRIVFRIIPDDNVRLANLRSGDIDVMHQVAPTDATSLKKEGRFEVSSVTGLGFNSVSINLHNKTGQDEPAR
jgi:peptide/nickel transport system substrate-binding protein